MLKREYKVINQPLSLRSRVLQPGSMFSVDEVIGGAEELGVLLKEKRVEKIEVADGGQVEEKPLSKSDAKRLEKLEAENEKLAAEFADMKAENEKLSGIIEKSKDAKRVKASFEEYEKMFADLEAEIAELQKQLEEAKAATAGEGSNPSDSEGGGQ